MNIRWIICGLIVAAIGGTIALTTQEEVVDTIVRATDMRDSYVPLYAGVTIGQTIRGAEHGLSAVGLQLVPFTEKRPSGRVILHLRQSPDEMADLRTSIVPAQTVRRDVEARFRFEPLLTSHDTPYFLVVEFPDGLADQSIGVLLRPADDVEGEPYGRGQAFRDGQPTENDLAMTLYHQERPAAAVIIFGGLAIAGLALGIAGLSAGALPTGQAGSAKVGLRRAPRAAATGTVVLALPFLWIMPLVVQWAAVRESAGAIAQQWSGFSLHAGLLSWFGAAPGMLASALLGSCIAATGMMTALRKQGRSRSAAIAGTAVFAFSSFMSLHAIAGTGVLLTASFLPWIVAFANMSANNPRAFGGMVAAIGLMLWSGGIGAWAGLIILLLLHLLIIPPLRRTIHGRRMIPWIIGVDLLLVLLAWQSPATSATAPSPPLSALRDILLDPRQLAMLEKFPGQELPWTEYGAYIGILGGVLALVGLIVRWRFIGSVAVTGVLATALTFAYTSAPWVHHAIAPVQLRRITMLSVFAIAWAAAAGFDALREGTATRALANTRWGQRFRTALFLGLTLFVVSELLFVSATTFRVPVPESHLSPSIPFEPFTANLGILMTCAGLLLARPQLLQRCRRAWRPWTQRAT